MERNKKPFLRISAFWKGILFSIVSGACIASFSAISKYMDNVSPWQILTIGFFATTSLSLPWAVSTGENLLGPRDCRILMAVRSILAAASLLSQLFAVRYIPIGEAVVLISTAPIFVTLAARIVLKEALDAPKIISLITTIAGIILITGLHDSVSQGSRVYTTEDIYGFSAALVSVASTTAQFVLTRKIRYVSLPVFSFNGALVSFIVMTIFTICVGKFDLHRKGLQQFLIILYGIIGFIAQISLFLGLKLLEAGPGTTVIVATNIFLSFVFQFFLFVENMYWVKIIGAILVCCSVIFVGLSKQINSFLSTKCSRDELKTGAASAVC